MLYYSRWKHQRSIGAAEIKTLLKLTRTNYFRICIHHQNNFSLKFRTRPKAKKNCFGTIVRFILNILSVQNGLFEFQPTFISFNVKYQRTYFSIHMRFEGKTLARVSLVDTRTTVNFTEWFRYYRWEFDLSLMMS